MCSGNSGDGVYTYEGVTTTVRNCVVTANGSCGGAVNEIYHRPNKPIAGYASMTIADSIISDNSGPGVSNAGDLTILNSAISGNSACQDYVGGGISGIGTFKQPSFTTVINSTISGNSADYGGGIGGDYDGGVTIVNSTISGNSAGYAGGGIWAGFPIIVNSTISGNSAGDRGGGIFGSGDIRNSTLSGNSAGSGGGIYNVAGQYGASLEIRNTILRAGPQGENIFNDGGTVTSHGYNISSDNGSGYLTGPGDQVNTDPLLAPLQNNGGPTLTHAPLPGSPAVDAGDPNFTPPPFRDQRGLCYYRVWGRRIDIGSV